MRARRAGWAVALAAACALAAEEPPESLRALFDYDREAPLAIEERGVEYLAGARLRDISYESPRGNRVPAFVVEPLRPGRFAGIVFGHWRMKGSRLANRREFLEEAVVLTRSGVVSLLIDSPHNRPGFTPGDSAEANQQVKFQQVLDARRGVDVLLAGGNVDPRRLAYVGHGFGARVGRVLAGVEKRFGALVLMAGARAEEDRRLDSVRYLPHAAPAAVLFQYPTNDEFVPLELAKRSFERTSEPKAMNVYESRHALNARARRDRVRWLQERLYLRRVDWRALERVTPVH